MTLPQATTRPLKVGSAHNVWVKRCVGSGKGGVASNRSTSGATPPIPGDCGDPSPFGSVAPAAQQQRASAALVAAILVNFRAWSGHGQ